MIAAVLHHGVSSDHLVYYHTMYYTYSIALTLLAFSVSQFSCLQITLVSLSPASELQACNEALVML
jgi:hypothetical protein